MEDRFQAAGVDVRRDAGLSVTFADGHVAHFDLTDLRVNCPCATCRTMRDRGESPWPGPASPLPLRIEQAQLHGAWGLNITWNDGHGTGIFPFDALRRWSEERPSPGPGTGR